MTDTPRAVRSFILGLLAFAGAVQVFAWTGEETPHDDAALVVMPNGVMTDRGGADVKPAQDPSSEQGRSFELAASRAATVSIKTSGVYALWARLSNVSQPLQVTLSTRGNVLQRGVIGNDQGGAGVGGPLGFRSYYAAAFEATANAAVVAAQLGYGIGSTSMMGIGRGGDDALMGEFVADFRDPFISLHRVEKRAKGNAWYWWKAFKAELEPGEYVLEFKPLAKPEPGKAALLEAAFLSTAPRLTYPYLGDIVVPHGTYVRFRIDALPPSGILTLSASVTIHREPWRSDPLLFGADGLPGEPEPKLTPHVKTGYTRWYRLQDVRNVPGKGAASIIFNITDHAKVRGATQFASFPHKDSVVREFGWHIPDGTRIAMNMNVAAARHALVTFRDLERTHYDWALDASDSQLFPLTRGEQAFGNASGGATGAAQDYMFKVLRLLGFNATATTDNAFYSRHYGGATAVGHYWPPVYMPYDEKKATARYDRYYQNFFSGNDEKYRDAGLFQIADEPNELYRNEMSAPYWDYVPGEPEGRWVDRSGRSELHTRKTDYQNCIFEGAFQVHGRSIQSMGLRVGTDSGAKPSQFGFWEVGLQSRARPTNLRYGIHGKRDTNTEMRGATIGTGAHRFKIVYEGNSASLFIDGNAMPTLKGLSAKGGFGFYGQEKTIWDVTFRPIKSSERLAPKMPEGGSVITEGGDDLIDGLMDGLMDDLASDAAPAWAQEMPIKERIEQEWVMGGGLPGAHEGFRIWLAARGIKPSLFERKSMADVNILTLKHLAKTRVDRKRYYWSRRYSAYLTPKMFSLAGAAIHKYAPNKQMKSFVALSGHSLYMHSSAMPLDMFALARFGSGMNMVGGCSDYMSSGGSWWWDSHEAVAYTAAFFNTGGRNYSGPRHSFPMMHCTAPSTFRSYVQLGNQVKTISYFWYGPSYTGTEVMWSEYPWCYKAVSGTANRTAQVDDILSAGEMRPSRVALLYSRASEYWDHSAWGDKRALFLGLGHDYFRPELVTEEQITEAQALDHYDALYVLEPNIVAATQNRIGDWVEAGGLLYVAHHGGSRNEYNDPCDLLKNIAGLERIPADSTPQKTLKMLPVEGESTFKPYPIFNAPFRVEWPNCRVRARYSDGRTAWAEKGVGKGRVVYLGHQPGAHYSRLARRIQAKAVWNEDVRTTFTTPLKEAKIKREVVVDRPVIFASPLSTEDGTVVVVFNISPTVQDNVNVGVLEPGPPYSVQIFDTLTRVDAEYTYKAGRVWVTLPHLSNLGEAASQMIVIRRKPAPADPRGNDMRERTVRDLASGDGRVLSAALWFAGFHPEWKMGEIVSTFLTHPAWNARRSAAEAVGRLQFEPATARLIAAIGVETDGHVLGDQLVALQRVAPAKAVAACLDVLNRDKVEVRAHKVALDVLSDVVAHAVVEGDGGTRDRVVAAAESYSRNPDQRLSKAAEKLKAALTSEGR